MTNPKTNKRSATTLRVAEKILNLYREAGPTGRLPSHDTIMARAGCCRDAISRALEALEQDGSITRVGRGRNLTVTLVSTGERIKAVPVDKECAKAAELSMANATAIGQTAQWLALCDRAGIRYEDRRVKAGVPMRMQAEPRHSAGGVAVYG